MDRLIGLLTPNAVLHADSATVELGVQPEIVGAAGVAGRFAGGARVVHLAWLDGEPGAAWIHRGEVRVAFDFAIRDGRSQEIWLRSDRDYLESTVIEVDIAPLPRSTDQELGENQNAPGPLPAHSILLCLSDQLPADRCQLVSAACLGRLTAGQ